MPDQVNDQGQGGSTQQTGSTQSTQQSNTTAGTQTQQTSQPSTGTTGTDQAAKPGYTFQEDRKDWVPPHRMREITEKQRQADSRTKELERQIQALTNTVPKDEQTQKQEQIQEQFYKMFPWAKSFKDLTDDQIQRLLATPTQVQSANEFVNQGWEKHAKVQVNSLVNEVSDIIGGKLDEDAKSDLKLVFGNYIRREVEKAERTGEVSAELQRYLDGDDSLVKDFAKKWADRWFTPARRQVASQEVNRARRVPNSTGRSQQTQVERPQKFNSLDERLAFLANKAKGEGVVFGK